MPAVSVREGMYFRHQLIVKAYGDLIHVEGILFYPETNTAQQDRNSMIDFSERTAEVDVSRSILTRPFPGFSEHPSMEFAKIKFV
jgi:hypothetical protein